MLYIEVLLLAIGLSMDSLAVSVTGGAVLKNNCTAGNIIKIASVLGIFQAGMTVIGYTTLCGLGIATSIDALAVGISLAILKSPLLLQASTIGVVTFAISAFGVYFGNRFGKRIDLKLDLIGGLILIGIGTKILIEHVFFS